jgi:hypothetical protein
MSEAVRILSYREPIRLFGGAWGIPNGEAPGCTVALDTLGTRQWPPGPIYKEGTSHSEKHTAGVGRGCQCSHGG